MSAADPIRRILGVGISDVTRRRAIELIDNMIGRHEHDGRTRHAFFVNAHTLNLAAEDPAYRAVLNAADHVFGDGTGIRWAARLQGTTIRDNVNGTDLIPELFRATAGRGYGYYLLGADQQTVRRAADHATRRFPGWGNVGCHHGYLNDPEICEQAIRRINRMRPHLLLVGMGNPVQEQWIQRHRHRLDVPLCIGVGGLFDFWAGNVSRAPKWIRRAGHEWLWRLGQQPKDKAARYLVGNPRFLLRVLRETAASMHSPG